MIKKIEISKGTRDTIIIGRDRIIFCLKPDKLLKYEKEDKYCLKPEYRKFVEGVFSMNFNVEKTYRSTLNMKYDIFCLYEKSKKSRIIVNLKENTYEIRYAEYNKATEDDYIEVE